jgi:hypothetical protein
MMEDIWYCMCEDPIYDENGICVSCDCPKYIGEDD